MRSRGGGGGDEGRGEEERRKARRQGLMQFVGDIEVLWGSIAQIAVFLRCFHLCATLTSPCAALPSGATCHAGFNAQRAFDGQALWHRCSGDGDDVPLDDRDRGDRAAQNNKYAPERAEGALNAQLIAGRSGRSA